MPTIACTTELCALDHHESTPARHHRVVSGDGADHRVVASWTTDDPTSAYVELTHHDESVTLRLAEALFWARTLTAGGSWSPNIGSGTGDIATDLAIAAEILYHGAADHIRPPDFGSRRVEMTVSQVVSGYFDDNDEGDA